MVLPGGTKPMTQPPTWYHALAIGNVPPEVRADGNRELCQRLRARKVTVRPGDGRASHAKLSRFSFKLVGQKAKHR
jgi:hypothetical protein